VANTNRLPGASPVDDKKIAAENSSYSYFSGSDVKLNQTSQQDNYISQGEKSNLEQVQEMIESKG